VNLSLVDVTGRSLNRTRVRTVDANLFESRSAFAPSLRIGRRRLCREDFPVLARITALRRPSQSYPPPLGKGQLWRLISQLSLTTCPLTEDGVRALQEILRVHNFTDSSYLENQIAGITSLSSQSSFCADSAPVMAVSGSRHRVRNRIGRERSLWGRASILAGPIVLERFLGAIPDQNSFCQLAAQPIFAKGDAVRMGIRERKQRADLRFERSRERLLES